MECPACGKTLKESAKFCSGCGSKLSEDTQVQPGANGVTIVISADKIMGNDFSDMVNVKALLGQELNAALKDLDEAYHPAMKQNISTQPEVSSVASPSKTGETEELSYETGDARKIEYKALLKEVFADGRVTADELIQLSQKIKELGLDKVAAQNIQADVARELNFNVDDEGDLISSGIVLEINTKKAYFVDEMDDLEFRITNISDGNFEKTVLVTSLVNLKKREEKNVETVKMTQRKPVSLPFCHERRGNELVEVFLSFLDAQGNPHVYRSEFRVRVLTREEEKAGAKSITISISAEKIMGNDFSNMAEILDKDRMQTSDKKSSYEGYEKQWRRLPIFFYEDETNRRRNEITIQKKLKEGEKKFREGSFLIDDAGAATKAESEDLLRQALDCLKESEECFKKIRELDPENTISLEKLRGVRNIISDIKGKIGTSETEPEMPAVRISSGCMALQDMRKKIYLYSKDRITMGRDSKNDIVLRIIPYQPKEQYPENWQKSSQISSLHAEILNKTGQFFIRDIGGGNAGSANGTYLDGKRAKPMEAYPLKDNMRINIAKVLDLECIFLGEYSRKDKVKANVSTCVTVLGEVSDSCFGIDKMGAVDAIKIKRRNNFSDGEKYVIVIREVTVGRSKSNGISIDREKVSDIHARLFFRDNQYWLEDLNSRYGTWVNGKRINPGDEVSLGTNSEIVLGDAHIRFEGFK